MFPRVYGSGFSGFKGLLVQDSGVWGSISGLLCLRHRHPKLVLGNSIVSQNSLVVSTSVSKDF